jgi:hypothetical protein
MTDSLDKTEEILDLALATLRNLEYSFKKMERALSTSKLPTSSTFLAGSTDGVVCSAGALITGTSLTKAIESTRGSGRKLPPLALASDSGEAEETNLDIVRTIRKHMGSPRYIVTLRSSGNSLPMDTGESVFIGTRYMHGSSRIVSKLEDGIRKIGFEPVMDQGEFGGGALVFTLIENFAHESDLIVELTLSQGVVENHDRFLELLLLLGEI